MAPQDGVGVHLLERRAAVLDDLARDGLQPLGQRDGVLAPVRLEVADHDVDALRACSSLRLGQHLIGLADAGGVAQEDLEPTARRTPS